MGHCSAVTEMCDFSRAGVRVQAAAAYDSAARKIRGDSAICNFPISPQEEANTAKYLDRMAASVRKRRHGGADDAAPPLCLRRLTARQKSKLASQRERHPESIVPVCPPPSVQSWAVRPESPREIISVGWSPHSV